MNKTFFAVIPTTLVCVLGCAGTDAFKDKQRHWRHKHQPQITAVSSNPCEPEGIPYYLPKPLLIITKNVAFVDGENLGAGRAAAIPDSFANQAEYGSVNASVAATAPVPNAPGSDDGGAEGGEAQSGVAEEVARHTGVPMSGAMPAGSYDARIVFVPDMSQKYFLRVTGGPGEIRAALNLVNGWMFTGPGAYYQKDSSKAQNTMAFGAALKLGGSGAADVINSIGSLRSLGGAGQPQSGVIEAGDLLTFGYQFHQSMEANGAPLIIPDYAEVRVYEQDLSSGVPAWVEVIDSIFSDRVFGFNSLSSVALQKAGNQETLPEAKPDAGSGGDGDPFNVDGGGNGGDVTEAPTQGLPQSGLIESAAPLSLQGFEQSAAGNMALPLDSRIQQAAGALSVTPSASGLSDGKCDEDCKPLRMLSRPFNLFGRLHSKKPVQTNHIRDTVSPFRSNLNLARSTPATRSYR